MEALPETVNIRSASQLLTFLDRFGADQDYLAEEVGKWDVSKANRYEIRFIQFFKTQLLEILKEINLSFIVDDKFIRLITLDDQKPLRNNQILSLMLNVEKFLYKKDIYNYEKIIASITNAILKIVETYPYFKSTNLSEIHTTKIVPFNEEWSVQIDISFEGGANGGNTIVWPDANSFTDVQIKGWEVSAFKPNRVYRDYFFRAYRSPAHEIVHCLQAKLKMLDSDPLSWSSEHDASYLCGPFIGVLAQKMAQEKNEELKELFFPGLFEELLVVWLDEVKGRYDKIGDEINKEYEVWRDAFGLKAPSKIVENTPGASYYFKDRIALEALIEDENVLAKQLRTVFDGRSGDVYSCPLIGLDEVKISAVNSVENLSKSVPEETWKTLFQSLNS